MAKSKARRMAEARVIEARAQPLARRGFKLVSVLLDDKGNTSFYSAFNKRVEYRLFDWTTPRPGDGPLAVFSNFPDAHDYMRSHGSDMEHLIVPCVYIPAKSRVKSMWIERTNYQFLRLGYAPKGTVLAAKVLIEPLFLREAE